MKRVLIIFGLSFAALSNGAFDDRAHFGIQGGMNFSGASVSPSTARADLFGISAGVLMEMPLKDSFFLQPELNFVQKGAENNFFGSLARTRMTYLELPVLLKAKLDLDFMRLNLFAGPKISYLLSAGATPIGAGGVSVSRGNFSDFDLGANLGVGSGFDVGWESQIFVTLQYSFGLLDVAPGAGEWRNSGFQFLVGLWL